ncbi:MAG: hypothetical protein AAB617_00490 [Patescibacteria group bacterium]
MSSDIILNMKLRKSQKQIFGTALILVAVFGGYFILRTWSLKLPNDFLIYRQNTADVSEKIVALANEVNEKIKAVNISDLNGEDEKAVALILDARGKNIATYSQAFELSKNLENLARSLDDISSRRTQRLAYEAVAVELSLVSEFIVYTRDLNNFLDSLSHAIVTGESRDREMAQKFLDDVNKQVSKINSLNKEFAEKTKEFNPL